jgi:hypothetical protein
VSFSLAAAVNYVMSYARDESEIDNRVKTSSKREKWRRLTDQVNVDAIYINLLGKYGFVVIIQ